MKARTYRRLQSYRKQKRAEKREARFNHSLTQDDLSRKHSVFYERARPRNVDSVKLPRSKAEIGDFQKARAMRESLIKDLLESSDFTIVDFNISVGEFQSQENPPEVVNRVVERITLTNELRQQLKDSAKNRIVRESARVPNFPALQNLLAHCWNVSQRNTSRCEA